MTCNQCNKSFTKFADNSIKLCYFDKTFHFCSHQCHNEYAKENYLPYWEWIKKHPNLSENELILPPAHSIILRIYPIRSDTGYFRKEYGWVAQDIKKLISKEEAIKIYNFEINHHFEEFFNMLKKDFPSLYKYWNKRDISLLMFNVGLEIVGEII